MDIFGNDLLNNFQYALKEHAQGPSFITYNQLYNMARTSALELKLKAVKVAILRNITVEPLLPIIGGEMVTIGFAPEMYISDFDAIHTEVFNPQSRLYKFTPDYFLLFQWLEILSPNFTSAFVSLSANEINLEILRLVTYFDRLFFSIRANSSNPILLNNFPLPDFTTLGILDVQSENSQTYSLLQLNLDLVKVSQKYSGVYWIDTLKLFNLMGYQNSFDEKFWQIAKLPFSKNMLLPLGREFGKFFRCLNGQVKKCLVLDCDNTLWEGIVGEDGAKGIKITSAFQAFQQEVLNFYNRGILLALCSKNNEADVLEVFRQNSDMVLKIEHFATWYINWNDKATNLRQIASQLNIGLDSLVFVDDSLFECNLVREYAPEVVVIELKTNPSLYRKQLLSPGIFDSLSFTEEDKMRNKMYFLEGYRKELFDASHSVDDYLFSLQIKAKFGIVTDFELPRVCQLIQKTNQFNLTSRRYSEGELRLFVGDHNYDVFYINISDKVSSLGIVGVGIICYKQRLAVINSFLVSCRSLGRGAENALLCLMINEAKAHGCTEIFGEYISSKKNSQVAEFYKNNNFRFRATEGEVEVWCLVIDSDICYKDVHPKWIQVLAANEVL